jgi:hypothetical protein
MATMTQTIEEAQGGRGQAVDYDETVWRGGGSATLTTAPRYGETVRRGGGSATSTAGSRATVGDTRGGEEAAADNSSSEAAIRLTVRYVAPEREGRTIVLQGDPGLNPSPRLGERRRDSRVQPLLFILFNTRLLWEAKIECFGDILIVWHDVAQAQNT